MKVSVFLIFAGVAFTALPVGAVEEQWSKVSTGKYMGYAELYVLSEGNYIIEGDTNLGVECALQVSKDGVDCDGTFFPWDHPGLQASRETKEGWERINFRGKVGNVVVADLTFEQPKGKVIRVLRMSVVLAPENEQPKGSRRRQP